MVDNVFNHSTAQKTQSLYGKEVEAMNEAEYREKLIQKYADLQRIKTAVDKEKEVDYQIKLVKAQLEGIGIIAENLDIH